MFCYVFPCAAMWRCVKMCCYVRLCAASDYVFVNANTSYYEMILYLRPCVTMCCFVWLSVTMYKDVLLQYVWWCVVMCERLYVRECCYVLPYVALCSYVLMCCHVGLCVACNYVLVCATMYYCDLISETMCSYVLLCVIICNYVWRCVATCDDVLLYVMDYM
jgi:hypothetical protein